MCLDAKQLREYVVKPTLQAMGAWSVPAEDLVMGTAAQESRLTYIDQLDRLGKPGPAYGLWQMERLTHDDLFSRFLQGKKPHVLERIRAFCLLPFSSVIPVEACQFNLRYGAAMCRVKYLSHPDPIPDTLEAQAAYYKRVYNTPLGKATPEQYLANYRAFCI